VCGRVVPETVAAVRVVVTPVAIAFAVVPDKTVAAAVVAATYVAMGFAVPPDNSVVTGQYVAMRAKNVVQIQVLTAAHLMKFAVKGTVATPAIVTTVTASPEHASTNATLIYVKYVMARATV